jgi:hypothetical protein
MSKSRKPKGNVKPPAPSSGGSRLPRSAAIVLAIVVVAAGGFWWSQGWKPDIQPATGVPPGALATNAPASNAGVTSSALVKLKGKWRRPDGGYVIEIKSVEPGGKMDAAYFNPQPINVSRAQAAEEGATVKVFIELRGANYPGSTYTLFYDGVVDQLKGIYYQAAMQQQFEVFFERLK